MSSGQLFVKELDGVTKLAFKSIALIFISFPTTSMAVSIAFSSPRCFLWLTSQEKLHEIQNDPGPHATALAQRGRAKIRLNKPDNVDALLWMDAVKNTNHEVMLIQAFGTNGNLLSELKLHGSIVEAANFSEVQPYIKKVMSMSPRVDKLWIRHTHQFPTVRMSIDRTTFNFEFTSFPMQGWFSEGDIAFTLKIREVLNIGGYSSTAIQSDLIFPAEAGSRSVKTKILKHVLTY